MARRTVIGHQNYVPQSETFVLRTVEPIFKELEIETEHKMEVLFQWLLIFDTIQALNPFIVTYLNQPHGVARRYRNRDTSRSF
ncbi:MAG: hypothetical protein H7Z16_09465 [Pyrinomonadaceae bacterium]|nr:hypothetical protein [Pyrinomonadaceae bacterium]